MHQRIPTNHIFSASIKRKASLLLTLAILLLCLCPNIEAQSPEEMQMLSLFYEEKDLVITPTRYPKPIYQVAENITVLYSDEIEAMNAHTVADVLRLVPGVFVSYSQDFGATSLLGIQGSEDRHVTVLVDGIRWNFLSGGNAETNTIPVGIIDRIEVIKGPASSAWGSALGGVINIITRPAGATETPGGTVRVSYGEAASLDASAQVSGKTNGFGYYLYAGKQKSDGLLDDRSLGNISMFSKFTLDLTKGSALDVSAGYSEPENDLGSFPSGDIRSNSEGRTVYANAALDLDLAPRTTFTLSGFYLSQDLNVNSEVLGLGYLGPAGDPFLNSDYRDETWGAAAKIVWEPEQHTVVMGTEISRGDLEQAIRAGDLLQMIGAPALALANPDVVSLAVYVNDTIPLGRWALTPGLRFDHNTVSGDFVSPSLGVTFRPRSDLLFRGTVSRGFQYPPLSLSEGGGLFFDPNPDLEAEEVWTYQAGVETTALPVVRVKTTLFLYEFDKTLTRIPFAGGAPAYNDLYMNLGGFQRRGLEVELKTDPVAGFSAGASGTYVHFDEINSVGSTEYWAWNLVLSYDNPDIVTARLSGHFEDLNSAEVYGSNFDDIIWDLNLARTVFTYDNYRARLFVTAHNLFDGSQYNLSDTRNPSRWIEGGIKFVF